MFSSINYLPKNLKNPRASPPFEGSAWVEKQIGRIISTRVRVDHVASGPGVYYPMEESDVPPKCMGFHHMFP